MYHQEEDVDKFTPYECEHLSSPIFYFLIFGFHFSFSFPKPILGRVTLFDVVIDLIAEVDMEPCAKSIPRR